MRKPRALRPGDRVAVVAPASPFKRDEFEAGIAEIRALGFEPVYDDSVFARHGYVAGTPDVRASAFVRAWEDPSIAALVAARGGYGSVQMLPLLDRAGHLAHTPRHSSATATTHRFSAGSRCSAASSRSMAR